LDGSSRDGIAVRSPAVTMQEETTVITHSRRPMAARYDNLLSGQVRRYMRCPRVPGDSSLADPPYPVTPQYGCLRSRKAGSGSEARFPPPHQELGTGARSCPCGPGFLMARPTELAQAYGLDARAGRTPPGDCRERRCKDGWPDNQAGTVVLRSRGCDRASPPITQKPSAASPTVTRP